MLVKLASTLAKRNYVKYSVAESNFCCNGFKIKVFFFLSFSQHDWPWRNTSKLKCSKLSLPNNNLNFMCIGVNFNNVLHTAFTLIGPKAPNDTADLTVFLCIQDLCA